jgi:hypothetical protein
VRRLYAKEPSAADLEESELTMEEACPTAEIWPDNLGIVNTFLAMGTQWRASGTGLLGLDYNVLPMVMRLTGVPRAEWQDVFWGLGVMEAAALEQIHKT